jgi:hypothetical protein
MPVRIRKTLQVVALAASIAIAAGPAAADEYDPQSSGHPVRIVAYVLHPVGVVLDTLIFRPAHWLVMHEPMKTVFGHTD